MKAARGCLLCCVADFFSQHYFQLHICGNLWVNMNKMSPVHPSERLVELAKSSKKKSVN